MRLEFTLLQPVICILVVFDIIRIGQRHGRHAVILLLTHSALFVASRNTNARALLFIESRSPATLFDGGDDAIGIDECQTVNLRMPFLQTSSYN